ncbi:fructosyl amine:oxygen oxidoreductase [Phlyctema vagabunda]|uniref:Fructosyl amine:oxygen oxidoreductase n=1 Tax=Phlyctema vagabunda TaxID=108571 RepID=A0ABR4PIS3_9HELO
MTTTSKESSVLIVGAGTWGCSTALHLARRGYTNITVLDPYDLPSAISAGNDVNKIIEEGQPDPDSSEQDYVSQRILELAYKGWISDPVFQPYFHNTGFIIAAHTAAGIEHLTKREMRPDYEWLDDAAAFRKTMPAGVLTGAFPGWKGGYKKDGAGWVFARGALMSAFHEAERLGVRFVTGEKGDVRRLVIENADVVGVETADGVLHDADLTILAAGANSDQLLDMKDQLRPTAWTLGHIQMTPEECELYKDLPVLFNLESGFFMEPDATRGELKICDEHPGYCNWHDAPPPSSKRTNVPFARHQVPLESEARMRDFLTATMPQLAARPLVFARICWCADTPDRNFLIDRHPELGRLVLAVGASGHGFMHITSVGGFVADVIEGALEPRLRHAFRWRPETAVDRDWGDVLGRRGGPNKMMNFGDVEGWTSISPRT